MRSSGIVVVLAAAALSACVKYQARPLDPPRSEQQFRTRSLADPGLQAFLKRADWPPQKLTLDDLSSVAIYFSPDLDLARAQLRTAQAAVLTAKGRPNPSVASGAGYTNAPESSLAFHFDTAFTLETAGKRRWRILEAEKQAEAARVALAETEWHVRSRVRVAWLDYLIAVRSLDLYRREREVRAANVQLLEKRLAAGEAAQPDVNVARTALLSLEVDAQAAQTAVHETGAALAAAVALPSLPPVDLDALPATPASFPLGEVQKAGLLHRADIRRSLLDYAAAEAGLHLEIANQYPNVDLSPSYAFEEGYHMITFGPALALPLLNRNQGPIAEAEARRAEAESRFKGLQAQAIGEMQVALARYQGGLEEFAAADRRLMVRQQQRESAMRRAVTAGEEDRLALVGVQTESAVAARARLQALQHLQSALGALEDAVQQPLPPGHPLPDPEIR